MTNHTYLKRRGAIYYARMPVPLDVQPTLKKSELAKSLNTSDLREAKRALPSVIDAWQREFDRIRASKELTAEDLDTATWQHYSDELETDSQFRLRQATQEQMEKEQQRVY